MRAHIYIDHSVMFISDPQEKSLFPVPTLAHIAQGFARRPVAMSIFALSDEDAMVTELERTEEALERCAFIIEFSLISKSGHVVLEGTCPGAGLSLYEGVPGWVRLVVGQGRLTDDERPELLVVAFGEPADGDAPTRVWRNGNEVLGPFIEDSPPTGPA